MRRTSSPWLLLALAALAGTGTVDAANIAKATRKDGAIVHLTDAMLPECNRLNFHGTARIERGTRVQMACWNFDWKKRVFTVIPLTPRNAAQGVVAGVMALGGGTDSALRELAVRYNVDADHQFSLPADRFQWDKGAKATAPVQPAGKATRSR